MKCRELGCNKVASKEVVTHYLVYNTDEEGGHEPNESEEMNVNYGEQKMGEILHFCDEHYFAWKEKKEDFENNLSTLENAWHKIVNTYHNSSAYNKMRIREIMNYVALRHHLQSEGCGIGSSVLYSPYYDGRELDDSHLTPLLEEIAEDLEEDHEKILSYISRLEMLENVGTDEDESEIRTLRRVLRKTQERGGIVEHRLNVRKVVVPLIFRGILK